MDDNTPVSPSSAVYLLSPEQIAGPYFRNPKLIRRNISEGVDGIPLVLRLAIVDAMTGQPVTDALVDIWHCNARGAYSGWSKVNPDKEVDVDDIGSIPRTDDDTYLRGGQFTDKNGIVRFTTIYPGFYAGRALHIHVVGSRDRAYVVDVDFRVWIDLAPARIRTARVAMPDIH